jgi:HD-GYP domain-containing protein (c-di-GMP phosphodiesterase class II)
VSIYENVSPEGLLSYQSSLVRKRLECSLNKLNKKLKYDLCLTYLINESGNAALLCGENTSDRVKNLIEIPKVIHIQNTMDYIFHNMLLEKSILERKYKPNSSLPMIDGIKSELYIPAFVNKKNSSILIGYIYFGSFDYREYDCFLMEKNPMFLEYISIILKLLDLLSIKENPIHNLIDLSDIVLECLKHKDPSLPGHSHNVASLSSEIAVRLKLPYTEVKKLYFGGLLHDVGKSIIDKNILNKPGPLTVSEFEIIKNHPISSYNISERLLVNTPQLEDVPIMIKHHHERYDGKGYPDGLKGNEVPFGSYIIGISDAVDTMLSSRSYKESFPVEKVIEELNINKGKQFHPQLVDIMVDKLANKTTPFSI